MIKYLLDLPDPILLSQLCNSQQNVTESYSVNGNMEIKVIQTNTENRLIIESLFKTDLKIDYPITDKESEDLMEEFGLVLNKVRYNFLPNHYIDVYERPYYGSKYNLAILNLDIDFDISKLSVISYIANELEPEINSLIIEEITNNSKYTDYKLAYLNKIQKYVKY